MNGIYIIGGGAAGFMAAITAKEHFPQVPVTILEKTGKLLAKVKISGGGRCNVTHNCPKPYALVKHYPRGQKFMRKPFDHFHVLDTVKWFESRGVALKTEDDGRMFPVSNVSQTVVDCLMHQARQLGVRIELHAAVASIQPQGSGALLTLQNGKHLPAGRVILATGGMPKLAQYQWLKDLGLDIVPPVPSLFTFNCPEAGLKHLAGVSVPAAKVRIEGTDLAWQGPLLITHWGFSGPAVLKLSAWGARTLAQHHYQFTIQISWVESFTEQQLRQDLGAYQAAHPKQQVGKHPLFGLPARLWLALCQRAGLTAAQTWQQMGKKGLNRLLEGLLRATFKVQGKTTFKEEFVTAGGVALSQLNAKTMQHKQLPWLYVVGEVLDVDGITGGFNFQNAWTSGYLAGKHAGTGLVQQA